jgi:integrase/recombinase XerD
VWDNILLEYRQFLVLEQNLSNNTLENYMRDMQKLITFLNYSHGKVNIQDIKLEHLRAFLAELNEIGIAQASQARQVSSIKSFFRFLLYTNKIESNPSSLLEAPRLGRKLPVVLSIDEIDMLIGVIDLSKADGHRNKAIIETLYGCGLRVSELVGLRLTDVYTDEGFVRVKGKGDKERLVPISKTALTAIEHYKEQSRNHLDIKKESQDILFLNRRGGQLSRVMIFNIIKKLAELAGVKKTLVRIHSDTHLLPILSKGAPIYVQCRKCWAMNRF